MKQKSLAIKKGKTEIDTWWRVKNVTKFTQLKLFSFTFLLTMCRRQ